MDNPKFKENDIVYYAHYTFHNVEIKEVKILYLVSSLYHTNFFYCCQETKYNGTFNRMEEINEEKIFLLKNDAIKFAIETLNFDLQKVNKQKEYLDQEIVEISDKIQKLSEIKEITNG